MDELARIEKEGYEAFCQGSPATVCPYSFMRSEFWDAKDYEGFERKARPKMNAWMRGWIKAKNDDAAGTLSR